MTVDRAPRSMEIPVELLIADDHELVRRGLIRITLLIAIRNGARRGGCPDRNGSHPTRSGASPRCGYSRPLHARRRRIAGRRVVAGTGPRHPDHHSLYVCRRPHPAPSSAQMPGVSAHYLAKNEAPQKLVHAVERVLAGEPFFASSSAASASRGSARIHSGAVSHSLTGTSTCFSLLARGKSNKELAARTRHECPHGREPPRQYHGKAQGSVSGRPRAYRLPRRRDMKVSPKTRCTAPTDAR